MKNEMIIKGTSASVLKWYAEELLKRIEEPDFFTEDPARKTRLADSEISRQTWEPLSTDKLEIASKTELAELGILKFTFPETFSKLYFEDMRIMEKDSIKKDLSFALRIVIGATRDFC